MATIYPLRLRLSTAFLVIGERPVLVDAGSPGEADKIVRAMAKYHVSPGDLSLILLTHAHTDHAGSAKELRQRSGAPVALHPADGEMLRRGTMGRLNPLRPRHRLLELYVNKPFDGFEADVDLHDGQRLVEYGLAAEVVETPGHSAGSVSVVLDRPAPNELCDALIGDLLIGGFLGGLIDPRRPRLPYFAEDYGQILDSVATVADKAGGHYYCGHGGPLNALETAKWRERIAGQLPIAATG
ncbi:MAG: MBL fold metallo-hydrolase [Planctomycetota bacterium]